MQPDSPVALYVDFETQWYQLHTPTSKRDGPQCVPSCGRGSQRTQYTPTQAVHSILTFGLDREKVLALTVNTLLAPSTTKEQISDRGWTTLIIDIMKFFTH